MVSELKGFLDMVKKGVSRLQESGNQALGSIPENIATREQADKLLQREERRYYAEISPYELAIEKIKDKHTDRIGSIENAFIIGRKRNWSDVSGY